MTTAATTPKRAVDLDLINGQLADADAVGVVRWAVGTIDNGLVMTTSFGVQSAVLLHLVTHIVPDVVVVWIDTGFNFPETYRYAEDLEKRLSLNLKVYQSHLSPARMVALHGHLWEQDKEGLDRYDRIRKIEPLDRAFTELNVRGWLTGVRRDQTDLRKTLRKVERLNDVFKIHPLLAWTAQDVDEYLTKHDLPYHPLYEQGYPSVGDWHSTLAATGSAHEREGRFRGLKQECGLHVPQTPEENESRDSSAL